MRMGIFLVVSALILSFFAGFFVQKAVEGGFFNGDVTGKVVLGEESGFGGNYSWTTAICNSKNECIDVYVTCEDGRVKSAEPSSNLVKFPPSWNDDRNFTGLCGKE